MVFAFLNFLVSCYKVTFKTGFRADVPCVNQSDRFVSQEILFVTYMNKKQMYVFSGARACVFHVNT